MNTRNDNNLKSKLWSVSGVVVIVVCTCGYYSHVLIRKFKKSQEKNSRSRSRFADHESVVGKIPALCRFREKIKFLDFSVILSYLDTKIDIFSYF